MIYKTFHFKYSELDIDLMKIENILGYGEGNDRDIVNAVVEGILAEPDLFANIKAEYRIFDNITFNAGDKSVTIDDVNFQTHKVLFNQLKKADSIAIFLGTAGKEVGIKTRKAMAKSTSPASTTPSGMTRRGKYTFVINCWLATRLLLDSFKAKANSCQGSSAATAYR